MDLKPLLLIVSCATILAICQGVQVRSCSKNPSRDVVKVNWVHVSPTPLQLPGELSISASVTVTQPIAGDLTADVTISRKLGLMWLDLPCVKTPSGRRYGTCTYYNFCQTINQKNATNTCPRLLVQNNIHCVCPIQPGTYTISQTAWKPNIGVLNLPAGLISGEYQASIRLLDRPTMREIFCYDIDVTVADPPSSKTFGSLGRFLVNLFG